MQKRVLTPSARQGERASSPATGMGPLPAAVRHDPAHLSPERRAVLDQVRAADGPVTLAALADAGGRHPNTVREHLDALVRHGLVTRASAPPRGRGRPALLYSPGPERMPPGPSEYADLAAVLAETLARTNPLAREVAVEAGTSWGRRLAAAQPVPSERGSAPRDRLVAMLSRYGFRPETSRTQDVVRLTRCPLLDTARAFPVVVCNVHRGVACGALEEFGGTADGVELVAFAEPGACVLTVPRELASPAS